MRQVAVVGVDSMMRVPSCVLSMVVPVVACTPADPAELSVPEDPVAPPSSEERPSIPDARPADAPSPSREPLHCDAESSIKLRVAAAATPRKVPTARTSESFEQLVLELELGGTPVDVQLAYGEVQDVSGFGAIEHIEVVAVGEGAILITHHDLNRHVGRPRFFRGVWSDALWISPDSVTGDCAMQISTDRSGHTAVWSPAADNVCMAAPWGETKRLIIDGGQITPVSTLGPCEARLPAQHHWIIPDRSEMVAAAKRGSTLFFEAGGEVTLGRIEMFELIPGVTVFTADYEWSCGACDEAGEDADERPFRGSRTRLLVYDDRGPKPRAHWYDARWESPSRRGRCRPSKRGKTLRCADRTFEIEPDGTVSMRRLGSGEPSDHVRTKRMRPASL